MTFRSAAGPLLVLTAMVTSLCACTQESGVDGPEQRQMRVEPSPLVAGERASIGYSTPVSRGLEYRLEVAQNGSWAPAYVLVAQPEGSSLRPSSWAADDGSPHVIPDVGPVTSGTDTVVVPAETPAGSYRLCSSPVEGESAVCANVEIG